MEYMYKNLVKMAKKGDTNASKYIIGKLNPLICSAINRYAYKMERDDAYQEAVIIIMDCIKSYDEKLQVPFLSYVKSKLYYGMLNISKKYRPLISLDKSIGDEDALTYIDILEDENADIWNIYVKTEDFKMLYKAIDRLSQKQKEVILLYFFNELSLKEIASIRGVHYKTVLGLKNRAIQALRRELY
ncbi:MAG: sigma-70 family RNA polymerase sigma factor [Xylanivirga thermophila]|jgi:RNA polymerase sporulation-specific sigma factor|uniref:RNA polymerase sigma factor n=1 Tax=Xylanivirga thermophila TaxID=2496273 RepID=UPI0039F4C2F0